MDTASGKFPRVFSWETAVIGVPGLVDGHFYSYEVVKNLLHMN